MTATVTVLPIETRDIDAISSLHARAFGPGRFTRTAYRLREGAPLVSRFCRKAMLAGEIVAAIRFTEVTIGGAGGAVMLGPLAVEPAHAGLGYGRRLVAEGIAAIRRAGLALVILVGDEAYYGQFGFVPVPPGQIRLPGSVDPARLLAVELAPGALARFSGLLAADALARPHVA
jgi:predicted N-acetyltransferase YhbS